ncbi:uncharacterized protein VTP21DRAFT_6444 [Calcarisporiella thermophila]|uniref:uncharacterized protein n=1 Tax=Calcarisporiella thermophila TaxID=911321 RepID=UPI003741EDE1
MSEDSSSPQGDNSTYLAGLSASEFATSTTDALQEDLLTLRALVTTREAGVIIGKAGQTVAHLRDSTGVRAGVSKLVPGVNERILTVQGGIDAVAEAYGLVAQSLLENPPHAPPPGQANTTLTIRLLISHNLMGTIIGKQGAKIKEIQDGSGARLTAAKEMLPQSTERVVEVVGTVGAVRDAIREVGRCLVEEKERGVGTVLYVPGGNPVAGRRESLGGARRESVGTLGVRRESLGNTLGGGVRRESVPSGNGINDPSICTQTIAIPPSMVGCIIGKGGARIAEIRRASGCRIDIAREPHDESGDRVFTLQGTPEQNERALMMLYSQLEAEKERRLSLATVEENE